MFLVVRPIPSLVTFLGTLVAVAARQSEGSIIRRVRTAPPVSVRVWVRVSWGQSQFQWLCFEIKSTITVGLSNFRTIDTEPVSNDVKIVYFCFLHYFIGHDVLRAICHPWLPLSSIRVSFDCSTISLLIRRRCTQLLLVSGAKLKTLGALV